MGGPEVELPKAEEFSTTFEEVLKGYRRGRIDFVFSVVTQGGKVSRRAVVLPHSYY
jgi:hypothetical protein